MRNWFKGLWQPPKVSPTEVPVREPAPKIPSEDLIRSMTLPQTDRETFFLLYSKLAQQDHGATDLSFVGDGVLSMKRADGKPQTIYLSNLWIACRASPDDAHATIERHLTLIDGPGASETVQREQIVPMIKDEECLAVLGSKPEVAR